MISAKQELIAFFRSLEVYSKNKLPAFPVYSLIGTIKGETNLHPLMGEYYYASAEDALKIGELTNAYCIETKQPVATWKVEKYFPPGYRKKPSQPSLDDLLGN